MSEKQEKTRKQRLTTRQKKLVEELANPENNSVVDAAKKAGYSGQSAYSTVYTLMKQPYMSEAIEQRKKRALAHHNVTPEMVLGRRAQMMWASVDDVLNEQNEVDLNKARENGAIDCVKKLETETTFTKDGEKVVKTKLELYGADTATDKVANYIGLEKFNNETKPTNEQKAVTILLKLLADGIDKQKAIPLLCEKYDVTAEVLECVEIKE